MISTLIQISCRDKKKLTQTIRWFKLNKFDNDKNENINVCNNAEKILAW